MLISIRLRSANIVFCRKTYQSAYPGNATELGLNESEYLRLKALNRERVIKADELAELYSDNQEVLNKKIYELEVSFDKKFTAILSPSQLAAYSQYKHRPNAQIALSEDTKPAPRTPGQGNK